jgi:proteasome lid subunit RPN8/RPN11
MFDPDAHRELDAHCSESPRSEVCGVLVGFTGLDGPNRWTRVVSVIRGRHAREEQMSVTFTHETWEAVHDELSKREDKARVVGWYHTHPDFGIFYSAPDVFVHRNFFGLEGQVGVVVDPIRDERGVFANTPRGLQPIRVYEVVRQGRHGHLVECKFAEDALREVVGEARAAAEMNDADLHRALRASLDPIEAGFARLERRMSRLSWLTGFWMPVAMIVAFGAGAFFGGRSPGRIVTFDLDGRPVELLLPVQAAPEGAGRSLPKVSDKVPDKVPDRGSDRGSGFSTAERERMPAGTAKGAEAAVEQEGDR